MNMIKPFPIEYLDMVEEKIFYLDDGTRFSGRKRWPICNLDIKSNGMFIFQSAEYNHNV